MLDGSAVNSTGDVTVTADTTEYLNKPDLNVTGTLSLPVLLPEGMGEPAPGTIRGHYSFDVDFTDDSGNVRNLVGLDDTAVDLDESMKGAGSVFMDGVNDGLNWTFAILHCNSNLTRFSRRKSLFLVRASTENWS